MAFTVLYALVPVFSGWYGTLFCGQPSAALWEDQLFVTVTSCHSSTLYRGSFKPLMKRVRSPLKHLGALCGDPLTQSKIDIRDDRVLLCALSGDHLIFPMEIVPLLEDSNFGVGLRELCKGRPERKKNLVLQNDPDYIELREITTLSQLINPYRSFREQLLAPPHREADVPTVPVDWRDSDRPFERTYFSKVRHDILIEGPRSVRLFHAYKDKFFVSVEPDYLFNWYGDGKGKLAEVLPRSLDRQLRTGKFPTNFSGADYFAAYASGGYDYLVTNTGKVFVVVPKGKDGLEITAVWADSRLKIFGVVQDRANDAVYGWGFENERVAPERFYVKLAPKMTAVKYKRTVPLWNDLSDAYLESYECARAFRQATGKK